MTTILGPAQCHECRAHVWVVRRTVEVACEGCTGGHEGGGCSLRIHTHAIPDVAWTVVDAEGERHLCGSAD